MKATPQALESLRKLQNEMKFVEEKFYPGAPNTEIRQRCEARVNRFIADFLALLAHDASKEEILARAKMLIDSFGSEDTEEREKVEDYIGESMRSVGLDDWTEYI